MLNIKSTISDGFITLSIILLCISSAIEPRLNTATIWFEISLIFLGIMLHWYYLKIPSVNSILKQATTWVCLIIILNATVLDCPQSGIWLTIISFFIIKNVLDILKHGEFWEISVRKLSIIGITITPIILWEAITNHYSLDTFLAALIGMSLFTLFLVIILSGILMFIFSSFFSDRIKTQKFLFG